MAGGAGIVEVAHAVLHQPHRAVLQLRARRLQPLKVKFHARRRLSRGHELVDLGKEAEHRPPAIGAQLAADQVQRLHAVGAFIDQCDPAIADDLLEAPFAREARSAVHLQAEVGALETLVGQVGFHHRRQQGHVVAGTLAHFLVG